MSIKLDISCFLLLGIGLALAGCGSSGPKYLHDNDSCSTYLEASKELQQKWAGTDTAGPLEKYCSQNPDKPLLVASTAVGPSFLTAHSVCIGSWDQADHDVKLTFLEKTLHVTGPANEPAKRKAAFEGFLRDLDPGIEAFCLVHPSWTLADALIQTQYVLQQYGDIAREEFQRVIKEGPPAEPPPLMR